MSQKKKINSHLQKHFTMSTERVFPKKEEKLQKKTPFFNINCTTDGEGNKG